MKRPSNGIYSVLSSCCSWLVADGLRCAFVAVLAVDGGAPRVRLAVCLRAYPAFLHSLCAVPVSACGMEGYE